MQTSTERRIGASWSIIHRSRSELSPRRSNIECLWSGCLYSISSMGYVCRYTMGNCQRIKSWELLHIHILHLFLNFYATLSAKSDKLHIACICLVIGTKLCLKSSIDLSWSAFHFSTADLLTGCLWARVHETWDSSLSWQDQLLALVSKADLRMCVPK